MIYEARSAAQVIDSVAARDLPQPLFTGDPKSPFWFGYGYWTAMCELTIPRADDSQWYGSLNGDLPTTPTTPFTGTPLVEITVQAVPIGYTDLATDILQEFVQLGVQRGFAFEVHNFLWGGERGNKVTVYARQFAADNYPHIGGFGSFTIGAMRVAIGVGPVDATDWPQQCTKGGYYQLGRRSEHTFSETIKSGVVIVGGSK